MPDLPSLSDLPRPELPHVDLPHPELPRLGRRRRSRLTKVRGAVAQVGQAPSKSSVRRAIGFAVPVLIVGLVALVIARSVRSGQRSTEQDDETFGQSSLTSSRLTSNTRLPA